MTAPTHSLPRRVVVITGASSGIGRATALAFARRGAHVVPAHPRDEVAIGWPSRLARLGYALAPHTTGRLTAYAPRRFLKRGRYAPRTPGRFEPVMEGTGSSGGWRDPIRRWPSRRLPWSGLAVLGLAALATGAVVRRRRARPVLRRRLCVRA